MKNMKYVGVDGCRGGWLAVVLDGAGIDVAVFRSFEQLWDAHRDAKSLLVDIPIGLPGGAVPSRQADTLARKIVGPRHSSIFSPGVRDLFACTSYTEACEVNRKLTDKKLSIQYWGIMPKVREVDTLLQATPEALSVIRETHPEVCFLKASSKSMSYSKKAPEGIVERSKIISSYLPNARSIYARALKTYLRKDVARDDIVDAMILAVTARESKGELVSLPNPLEKDEKNLPMAIWYHDFKREL